MPDNSALVHLEYLSQRPFDEVVRLFEGATGVATNGGLGRAIVSPYIKILRRAQNMVLALAEVSGTGWITSQCSTTLPCSSRKMSTTNSPAALSERPCQ